MGVSLPLPKTDNEIGGQGYYAQRLHFEGYKQGKWSLSTEKAYYNLFDTTREGNFKILHTPELESFFKSIYEGLGLLMQKVEAVFNNPEQIVELAAGQHKLIG